MADEKTVCTLNECSTDNDETSGNEFHDSCACGNVSCTCQESRYFLTSQKNHKINSVEEKVTNNEINNLKQQLENYKKRVECLLKIKYQLQSDLGEAIQANLLMEQCITCPYTVKNGKVKFPGKNDLDKRFDCMFKALKDIKKGINIAQNDNYLAYKLDRVLQLPLPKCFDCHKDINKTDKLL